MNNILEETKFIMKKYNIVANKKLGQNFLVNEDVVEMPINKRRFMMGNALVVNLVEDMEKTLEKIFNYEK